MFKHSFSISIVVIGHNTKRCLSNLLNSINQQQKIDFSFIEVVYVDDASSDGSLSLFKTFLCKYKKTFHKNKKNLGRAYSRSVGLSLAKNTFILFTQSNVVFDSFLVFEYFCLIKQNASFAYVGKIIYSSKDKVFEKYLNNKKRGNNQFNASQKIPFRFMLFGNCLLHRKFLKDVFINKNLKGYGGEDLEFGYLFEKMFPSSIVNASNAVVYRKNHPGFLDHCSRFVDFGNKNFDLLHVKNQKTILKLGYYLKDSFLFGWLCVCFLNLYKFLYSKKIFLLNFNCIRGALFCAIIKGRLFK